jgi:hypothetical protein
MAVRRRASDEGLSRIDVTLCMGFRCPHRLQTWYITDQYNFACFVYAFGKGNSFRNVRN